jgi:hypothetical protein
VDLDLAPVITESTGDCEPLDLAGRIDPYARQGIAQQANAEGITFLAASGDLGPVGCD